MISGLPLVIRALQDGDEASFLVAHADLADDGFCFGPGYHVGMLWEEYLQTRADQQNGHSVPDNFVPATFLVATLSDEIVGRVFVRHTLNDRLRREGGHIGYCVVRRYRRLGIATALLRHGLTVAGRHGVQNISVTCDQGNPAS